MNLISKLKTCDNKKVVNNLIRSNYLLMCNVRMTLLIFFLLISPVWQFPSGYHDNRRPRRLRRKAVVSRLSVSSRSFPDESEQPVAAAAQDSSPSRSAAVTALRLRFSAVTLPLDHSRSHKSRPAGEVGGGSEEHVSLDSPSLENQEEEEEKDGSGETPPVPALQALLPALNTLTEKSFIVKRHHHDHVINTTSVTVNIPKEYHHSGSSDSAASNRANKFHSKNNNRFTITTTATHHGVIKTTSRSGGGYLDTTDNTYYYSDNNGYTDTPTTATVMAPILKGGLHLSVLDSSPEGGEGGFMNGVGDHSKSQLGDVVITTVSAFVGLFAMCMLVTFMHCCCRKKKGRGESPSDSYEAAASPDVDRTSEAEEAELEYVEETGEQRVEVEINATNDHSIWRKNSAASKSE